MKNKVFMSFFKLQVFIATQGVGTHHKKLSNNKLHCTRILSLHKSYKTILLYKCKEN